jgi:hypothetical protein
LIVLDTSGLLAAVDASHSDHERVARCIQADRGPFLLSPFVAAEVDYLLAARQGVTEELRFLGAVADGSFHLECFEAEDIGLMIDVVERYRDQNIGLADASLVVLAARAGTTRVLTFDERHFRVLQPLRGRTFTVLPADA